MSDKRDVLDDLKAVNQASIGDRHIMWDVVTRAIAEIEALRGKAEPKGRG